jgi:hypothetical protein
MFYWLATGSALHYSNGNGSDAKNSNDQQKAMTAYRYMLKICYAY